MSTVSRTKMLPSCARKVKEELYVAQKLQSRGQGSAVIHLFPGLCATLMHSRPGLWVRQGGGLNTPVAAAGGAVPLRRLCPFHVLSSFPLVL